MSECSLNLIAHREFAWNFLLVKSDPLLLVAFAYAAAATPHTIPGHNDHSVDNTLMYGRSVAAIAATTAAVMLAGTTNRCQNTS